MPTSGFVPAPAVPAATGPAATRPATTSMPTATVPVSTAVPATVTVPVPTTAVPRLDRASDRNRQRGCSNDEQLGCTLHRGLSVKVIRAANA
jgi:hypothetical protein